jgi:hypothetical protein
MDSNAPHRRTSAPGRGPSASRPCTDAAVSPARTGSRSAHGSSPSASPGSSRTPRRASSRLARRRIAASTSSMSSSVGGGAALWPLVATFTGAAIVRAEPFDAVDLDLSALWTSRILRLRPPRHPPAACISCARSADLPVDGHVVHGVACLVTADRDRHRLPVLRNDTAEYAKTRPAAKDHVNAGRTSRSWCTSCPTCTATGAPHTKSGRRLA